MKRFTIISAFALAFATLLGVASSTAATCTASQSLTEGPYYSTDTPVRSNIAAGQAGTKTKFTITVVDSSCKPVKGAKVDIWHANASGKYSAVEGVPGNFGRGTQVTNAAGKVTFTTIYPGWYSGRVTHIHAQIYVNNVLKLTTQIAFPEDLNTAVYNTDLYKAHGQNPTKNTSDSIIKDSLDNELAAVTANVATGGYDLKHSIVI